MAERNCKKCFHYNACKEVASHSGYADINYTESQCKNFVCADDVVKVIRCKDCILHEEGCLLDTHPYMTADNGYCYLAKRTPKERRCGK